MEQVTGVGVCSSGAGPMQVTAPSGLLIPESLSLPASA